MNKERYLSEIIRTNNSNSNKKENIVEPIKINLKKQHPRTTKKRRDRKKFVVIDYLNYDSIRKKYIQPTIELCVTENKDASSILDTSIQENVKRLKEELLSMKKKSDNNESVLFEKKKIQNLKNKNKMLRLNMAKSTIKHCLYDNEFTQFKSDIINKRKSMMKFKQINVYEEMQNNSYSFYENDIINFIKLATQSLANYHKNSAHGDLNLSYFEIKCMTNYMDDVIIKHPNFGIFNKKYENKSLEDKLLYQDFTYLAPEVPVYILSQKNRITELNYDFILNKVKSYKYYSDVKKLIHGVVSTNSVNRYKMDCWAFAVSILNILTNSNVIYDEFKKNYNLNNYNNSNLLYDDIFLVDYFNFIVELFWNKDKVYQFIQDKLRLFKKAWASDYINFYNKIQFNEIITVMILNLLKIDVDIRFDMYQAMNFYTSSWNMNDMDINSKLRFI